MKTVRFLPLLLSTPLVLPLVFSRAAAPGIVTTSDGTVNWGDSAIWSPPVVPNSTEDQAVLNGSATVMLADEAGKDASFTVRALDVKYNGGRAGTGTELNNVDGGTGELILESGEGPAVLFSDKGANRYTNINVGILLRSEVRIAAHSQVQLNLTKGLRSADGANTDVTVGGQRSDTASGIGWVTLSGVASTYTGATKVQGNASTRSVDGGGKLRIGLDEALPPGTVLVVEPSHSAGASTPRGGCFDLNGHRQTVAGLSGETGDAAGLVTNLTPEASEGLLVIDGSEGWVFSGSIADGPAGTMALVKKGNGEQMLEGINTYTGPTTVSGGSLVVGVSGAGALGGSAVTVSSGTLGGSGLVGGAVVVGDGNGTAVLAPGDGDRSIGTLKAASSVVLGPDSTLLLEHDGKVADQLAAHGVTIKGGKIAVTEIRRGPLTPLSKFVVIDNTSDNAIEGTFANLAEGAVLISGANRLRATYAGGTGNDLVLTVLGPGMR